MRSIMSACRRTDEIKNESDPSVSWINSAESELGAAESLLRDRYYEQVLYHSQQAIERALKAFQLKKYGRRERTHDLVLLGRELNLPEEYLKHCKRLTGVYHDRYPDTPDIDDIEEISEELLHGAASVVAWIKKHL
ncbi:MAG: hypothetical protein CVT48_00830 [Thermoplasmata archaeon HGW-Thermoplasmata-1]|nr:MAG: hypothetical protein CVT48_00830 [Thermoplasmata archaeon HGW-Thermoplasmata-1]